MSDETNSARVADSVDERLRISGESRKVALGVEDEEVILLASAGLIVYLPLQREAGRPVG
ncbi:MAG: hypothetical protein U0V48_05040 [Anaerolineales bacterium]